MESRRPRARQNLRRWQMKPEPMKHSRQKPRKMLDSPKKDKRRELQHELKSLRKQRGW